MADKVPVLPILPRNMRPRSTPNAEINAQDRDRFLREHRGELEPAVKDVPMKGYKHGGVVGGFGKPGKYSKR